MRNQKGEVIVNFQLKKTGKKHTVFMIVSANFQSRDENIPIESLVEFKKVEKGYRTFVSQDETVKYHNICISTKIESNPEKWDKIKKAFKGKNAKNIQLNNIRSLTVDVVKQYAPFIKESGFIEIKYLKESIEKLVFGKRIPEHKVLIKDRKIVDSTQISFSDKELKEYPHYTGDSIQLMENIKEHHLKSSKRTKVLTTRFSDYIENMRRTRLKDEEITPQTMKGYNNLKSFVIAFEKSTGQEVHIKDINEKWAIDFLNWARKRKQDNGKHYSYNYINETLQKQLKATCNYIQVNDKIDLEIEWSVKSLRKSKEKTQEIALTIPQLRTIIDLQLTPGRDSKIELSRNIFVVMCLTGLRISDFKYLNLEEQSNGEWLLNQITQKTKTQITFAVHPKVVELYKKYNGKFPSISEQKFNANIHKLGKLAAESGNNDFAKNIKIKRKDPANANRVIESEPVPFYDLISSSTCRRTFATFAVHSGVIPLDMVCRVTGHSKISQLMEYAKINEAELNEKLTSLYEVIKL
jgi:integrase